MRGASKLTVERRRLLDVSLLLLAVDVRREGREEVLDLRRALEDRLALVESVDLRHLLVRQLEIEQVEVLSDMRRGLGAGDDRVSQLHVPAEDDLSRGLAVSLRNLCDDGFTHDRGVAAPAQRVPRLQRDVVLPQERLEFGLREVGVALDLDKRGLDLGLAEETSEFLNGEVRNADCTDLPAL